MVFVRMNYLNYVNLSAKNKELIITNNIDKVSLALNSVFLIKAWSPLSGN